VKTRRTVQASLLLVAALVLGNLPVDAATISLQSDSDLNAVLVVQQVTINVVLSGLEEGETLDYLPATVLFDSAILGSPTTPIAGPIVPDENLFFADVGESSDFVTGLFDACSDPESSITSDGVFYSFSVTAAAPGSTSLSFEPDPLLEGVTLGNPLNLTSVVPEPASLAIWLSGLGTLAVLRRRGLCRR